ncbi:hypothetical protein KCP77_05970 [Salmonella enterica subsp. enterica]|nr:hypothetical protein KCP77_05970 [Salmonella enterica subsp. enterica]
MREISASIRARRDEHSAFILSSLSPDFARGCLLLSFFVVPLCGEGAYAAGTTVKSETVCFTDVGGRNWYQFDPASRWAKASGFCRGLL